ncbi:hypothetical protein [Myroides odoratimimus]|uniref:hypothetical protein n=1 Tax=Myroides odoratimimus TaxID=76832 RepID=UPI0025753B19|nr:hypothetical protein [Myroides odoratimimus]MDM1395707.1 hypothetical protein [Myroides odoratimimus]
MIISFDLDDTIISNVRFPLEVEPIWAKILGVERVRLGTIALFKELRNNGHKIYVYTTSYRSAFKIRLMFWSYGISIDCIINQQLHEKRLGSKSKSVSKLPSEFGIDIHVDDSLGVHREGDKYGFNTIIVDTDDVEWGKTVLAKVAVLAELKR